ncbi:hypothetical protein BJ508DRAFT_341920 [Ascobolus immersus RN42]|uniref:Uncharacterized protein n=1 Tax=Ascobolus immersus RN42 TaxID=1160509 RepID=A0A3N4HKN9_ASCIM|nr:hypothetical protein BJ508DRAFT_341920 [Ascobolus immersus RN42]
MPARNNGHKALVSAAIPAPKDGFQDGFKDGFKDGFMDSFKARFWPQSSPKGRVQGQLQNIEFRRHSSSISAARIAHMKEFNSGFVPSFSAAKLVPNTDEFRRNFSSRERLYCLDFRHPFSTTVSAVNPAFKGFNSAANSARNCAIKTSLSAANSSS